MYAPRLTYPVSGYDDPEGVKLYAIAANGIKVMLEPYLLRLEEMKSRRRIDWSSTASFAIFHEGAQLRYLVLCWWGNDNELLNLVSVCENGNWIEDTKRYSFCIWDLEVIWHERNVFIQHMYSGSVDLETYRKDYRDRIEG